MKTKLFSIFLILVASILAVRQMPFTTFFPSQDDNTPLRQLEMHKCFLDFQIPCRWVPDLGRGNGYPLFNFYPPLPYAVVEPLMLMGFSQYTAVKTSFFLSLFLSGISIYFLVSYIYNYFAGLVSGVFYIWAPYRAVDIYVRGALNESWSFVFLPLILLFSYKVIFEKKSLTNIAFLGLSFSGLYLSHNVIVMIFMPFYLLWVICLLLISKSFNKKLLPVTLGSILGLGLASFFSIPAFIEKKLVWLDFVNDYFDFHKHYVYLNQLFIKRFWGYGMSFEGDGDGMSFQIGHVLYIFAALSILFLLFKLARNWITKRRGQFSNNDYVCLTVFILGLFAIFMSTGYSQFIWELFPILALVQFPSRFLTLITLFLSISVGYFIFQFKNNWRYAISILAIILTIAFSWKFFLPEEGKEYNTASQAGNTLKDFLPKTSAEDPPDVNPGEIILNQYDYQYNISNRKSGTNWFNFNYNSNKEMPLTINRLEFPNWKVYIDGKITQDIPDKNGRIVINVPRGIHIITGKLTNSPIRAISNVVSLISIFITFMLFIYSQKYKTQ